jgi:hypothetical protein
MPFVTRIDDAWPSDGRIIAFRPPMRFRRYYLWLFGPLVELSKQPIKEDFERLPIGFDFGVDSTVRPPDSAEFSRHPHFF